MASTRTTRDDDGQIGDGRGSLDDVVAGFALIAQAYVAWLLWGLRSVGRSGVSWAGYGGLLARQLAAIGLGQRQNAIRLLLDETTAQLREIGDLSMQEAQALRKLLLELSAELRQLYGETHDEPHRYAKTKR